MSDPTRIADILRSLGYLPDDAELTITVDVASLKAALTAQSRGPEILTAEQAAQHFGFTPERWRRWAKRGHVDGAYQESTGGPWRLPKPGVEAMIRKQQRKAPARPTVVMQLPTTHRGVPRGPWKKAQTESA